MIVDSLFVIVIKLGFINAYNITVLMKHHKLPLESVLMKHAANLCTQVANWMGLLCSY